MKNAENSFKEQFRQFCLENGIKEECLFSKKNGRTFAETAIDGYTDYPVFLYSCGGKYKAKTLTDMFSIDFKSRVNTTLGIASDHFESVLLIEPPSTRKVGFLDYAKAVNLKNFYLLFIKTSLRQQAFENFALKVRKKYMGERTIYAYVFSTKMELQRQGYGKRLFGLLMDFAKKNDYEICLETNKESNIALYESFGFQLVESLVYKKQLGHYVMFFSPKAKASKQ